MELPSEWTEERALAHGESPVTHEEQHTVSSEDGGARG